MNIFTTGVHEGNGKCFGVHDYTTCFTSVHRWPVTDHTTPANNTFILAGVSGHLIRFSHHCCLTNSYKTPSHSCLTFNTFLCFWWHTLSSGTQASFHISRRRARCRPTGNQLWVRVKKSRACRVSCVCGPGSDLRLGWGVGVGGYLKCL